MLSVSITKCQDRKTDLIQLSTVLGLTVAMVPLNDGYGSNTGTGRGVYTCKHTYTCISVLIIEVTVELRS